MKKTIIGNPMAFSENEDYLSVAELYHENSKLHKSIPDPALTRQFSFFERQAMSAAYKRYPSSPHITLPDPLDVVDVAFDTVIRRRRSIRSFSHQPVTLRQVSKLLHQSYGITASVNTADGTIQNLRAAPSAGGLYPAELYIWPRNVTGLEPALYHYDVIGHSLEQIRTGDLGLAIKEVCCDTPFVLKAAVTIFISGVLDRTCRKYGDRGYRYVLLDIGHLAQNLYLSSTAQGLAVVTACSFYDEPSNALLGLDGLSESVLYVAFIGSNVGADHFTFSSDSSD